MEDKCHFSRRKKLITKDNAPFIFLINVNFVFSSHFVCTCAGVNNSGHSSEYVRRELRTMVSERTMNNTRPPQSPLGQNAMMGPNVTVNNNINNNSNNVSMSMAVQQQQQQQQMTPNSMMNTTDMGYFDLPTTGKSFTPLAYARKLLLEAKEWKKREEK